MTSENHLTNDAHRTIDPSDSGGGSTADFSGNRPTDTASEISTLSFLATCPPFDALPPQVVELLEWQMHERRYQPGEYLVRQSAPGESLQVVCDGTVEVSTVEPSGETHLIDRCGRGSVLGEMALLTSEPRSASAVAQTAVKALVLPAATFHELAARHPELTRVLSGLVATRLGRLTCDVLAGKTFHGYVIRRRLGKGGMSVVYEAQQVETGRRVALKMMSHRLVYDDAALALFRREADLIEKFDHPNIVRMCGRFAAFHTYFIVLEFADGETLNRVLHADGPLPEAEFRKILGHVAAALAYAHREGVVHRDVKPGNILLGRDGAVKLMDFGLAMPIEDVVPIGRSATIVGTPSYMAPEQLSGRAVSEATDYFALGCVAYEMLRGRPLFPGRSVSELIGQHREFGFGEFRELLPGLSDDVCAALDGCLRPDPTERRLDLERLAAWAGPVDPAIIPSQLPEDDPEDETESR